MNIEIRMISAKKHDTTLGLKKVCFFKQRYSFNFIIIIYYKTIIFYNFYNFYNFMKMVVTLQEHFFVLFLTNVSFSNITNSFSTSWITFPLLLKQVQHEGAEGHSLRGFYISLYCCSTHVRQVWRRPRRGVNTQSSALGRAGTLQDSGEIMSRLMSHASRCFLCRTLWRVSKQHCCWYCEVTLRLDCTTKQQRCDVMCMCKSVPS